MRGETGALVLSAVAALVLGGAGIAAAVLSNSQAILLDGLFNLCYFVTALFALRVAWLLRRPDDERYPFGYLYFEPLINTVKGLLILGISLFALVDAVLALAGGGRDVALGSALVYTALATLACLAVAWTLRRAARRLSSPLVQADLENWTVNAAISGGVFVAFCLAFALTWAGMPGAARLVDPLLVTLVVLVTLGVPVRMAGRGLMALLNRAPPAPVVAAIETAARDALADLPVRALYVRAVQPGRTLYAVVHVLLDDGGATLDVRRADTLRGEMTRVLAARHAPLILDVVFTAVEAFAAPGTGFVAQPAESG